MFVLKKKRNGEGFGCVGKRKLHNVTCLWTTTHEWEKGGVKIRMLFGWMHSGDRMWGWGSQGETENGEKKKLVGGDGTIYNGVWGEVWEGATTTCEYTRSKGRGGALAHKGVASEWRQNILFLSFFFFCLFCFGYFCVCLYVSFNVIAVNPR